MEQEQLRLKVVLVLCLAHAVSPFLRRHGGVAQRFFYHHPKSESLRWTHHAILAPGTTHTATLRYVTPE